MKTLLKTLLAWLLLAGLTARADSIINSVHNLSAAGPGTVKATIGSDACVFCHTAHHANGETPLWNHSMSSVSNYVVYSSARLDALKLTIPQPNGSSRLCLSCHDGTVALGNVSSGQAVAMQNGVTTMPAGANNLGTDLSSDHPISFVYDSNLAGLDSSIKDPSLLTGKVRLDREGRLQCTACHDPHNNQYGNFLVMDNSASALCLTCHNPPGWTTSPHALSGIAAPAVITVRLASASRPNSKFAARIKSATIAGIGCENCHISHRAAAKTHLMQSETPEQNCFSCHNGITVKQDLAADFDKPSVHPITLNSDSHSPVEDPVNPPMRHVTCADCHNAHAANAATAFTPNASGALAGVTGISAAGGTLTPLTKEYQLCFRCHADSAERGPATVQRQYIQTNTRLQFSTGNQSFHPVEAVGRNLASVPSLIMPWTVNSLIYCTDCHNSDSGPKAGGNGANGPHGSIYRPLLERNLNLGDFQGESAGAYALCYKCHSRPVVLSSASFPLHESHVVNDQAACTTCHDSHGVANAPHLVNFNTLYVTNSPSGVVSYRSTGLMHGVCTLTCHGVIHNNTPY